MNDYIVRLTAVFEKNANPNDAAPMKAYMKDRFEFYGLKSPLRRMLTKQFIVECGKPDIAQIEEIVFDLFAQPQRELHYAAIELCGTTRKDWTAGTISLFEKLALTNSWWDTVDGINSICLKPFFLAFTESRSETTQRWIDSGNIWLQRLSLIFQLRYKEKTDTGLLSRNILQLNDSNEFFVQKAIGWILRDYGFTNPVWVKEFVASCELKPLSKREALKRLS